MGHLNSTPSGGPGVPAAPTLHEDRPKGKSRWWLWIIILLAVGFGIWHFRGSTTGAQTPGSSQKGGRGGMNQIPPVAVATSQRGDLPVYYEGLGTVTAFNTVTVHTRVDGQLMSVAFKEGQIVHQGDLLVEIDPRPYQVQLEQAEGQMAHDQAALRDAQVNSDRYKQLWNDGVIAKQQFDTQVATVDQFQGSLKSDQSAIDNAKLELVYCRVTAPITGRIGLRLVDAGNIVHAADTNGLLVITQLQPIAVIFTLPQDQLPVVYKKLRADAHLPVDAYDRDDTTKITSGTLLTIDNEIDPTTGTYKLKSVFSNEDNALFPNQFVNIHLLVDMKRGLTIVPAAAIQRGPTGSYVYVLQPDGKTVKIQQVNIALTVGNNVGIDKGLNPNQVVVTDGLDKLQDGSKVDIIGGSGQSSSNSGDTLGGAGSKPQAGAAKKSGKSGGGQPQN
jgi:multidrug efflux system membrane fusion protein